MAFTTQYPITENNLRHVFPPETITIIWESRSDIAEDRKYFTDVLNKESGRLVCVISQENPFLPFLSAEDNVLLGLNKNRKDKQALLYTMLEDLELDRRILREPPQTLSPFTTIELLLARSFLCQQKLIVIDSILDELPPQQVQKLLNLFRHFCKQQQIAIALFTENKQIAKSSYGDVTLALYNQKPEKSRSS